MIPLSLEQWPFWPIPLRNAGGVEKLSVSTVRIKVITAVQNITPQGVRQVYNTVTVLHIDAS